MQGADRRTVQAVLSKYSQSKKLYATPSYAVFVTLLAVLSVLSYYNYISAIGVASQIGWGALAFFIASILAISFGHQAFHGAITGNRRLDKFLGALTFIPLGVDGHLWQRRHITEHHPEPNREGFDEDIDNPTYFRLSPYTTHRWYHRYQHLYAPVLYSIGLLVTITIDDVRQLVREVSRLAEKNSSYRIYTTVSRFVLFKVLWIILWVAVPLLYNSSFLLVTVMITMATASIPVSWFFLPIGAAHLNQYTYFFSTPEKADFFTQQSATTVDFETNSVLVTWLYGGLNYHLAHHLWPRIPASHYQALMTLLKSELRTSIELVPTLSLRELYCSHFSLLKKLGTKESVQDVLPTQHQLSLHH
jgi:linoleoyl-CoA desaturase